MGGIVRRFFYLDHPRKPRQKRCNPFRSAVGTSARFAAHGPSVWRRLHDLRRTAATGLQRLGVRLEVTEQVLNHVSGSRAGIVGVYQRHDFANEKRAALEAWGSHVEAIVEGRTPESNVLKMHA
jgi:integrase